MMKGIDPEAVLGVLAHLDRRPDRARCLVVLGRAFVTHKDELRPGRAAA